MIDALSLDQLRTFIASVDAGSFSAAARQLNRAQSAVSELVSRLEDQIGVDLFDRSGRYPQLTKEGAILLADARGIIADVDFMRARAKGMASGVEAELSVVVDVMFPIDAMTVAATEFRQRFPATPLRLFVEGLGTSFQLLLEQRVSLGIVGPVPGEIKSLITERLDGVSMIMVAAREHPLAAYKGEIPRSELLRHTQLVLTDRSALTDGKEFFVLSQSTWRLADLFVKRSFLLAGLGWGGMPRHAVEADLSCGDLKALAIQDFPREGLIRPAFAAYPTASPPGPAGRWLIERLKQGTKQATKRLASFDQISVAPRKKRR